MKKPTLKIAALALLCSYVSFLIICNIFSIDALHLGNVTIFTGKMPKNPPQGISISLCGRSTDIFKYKLFHKRAVSSDKTFPTEVDSLRKTHSAIIPYLSEILLGVKDSTQLHKLTFCDWDTLYFVKPHCTLAQIGITYASHELENIIGQDGPKDDTCVLVFKHDGKIVQYETIQNKSFNFKQAPYILAHTFVYSKKRLNLGLICFNRTKTEHTYYPVAIP